VVAANNRRSAAALFLLSSYLVALLALVKGLLFIPLYLRHFDVATYGSYLASANVVGILGVLDVGITTAFYQRLAFAHGGGHRDEFARLTGAGLVVLGITALFIGGIGWSISTFVPGWIGAPSKSSMALAQTFRLTVLGSAAMILNQGILGVSAAWQLPFVSAASRLGAQVIEMVVVVICLFSGWGLVSLGWGSLVGGLLSLMVTLVSVLRQWRKRHLPVPRPDRASFSWLLSVGIPTLLSRVMGQIAGNIEVVLVSAIMGPSVAAVYGITERTFRLVQTFINPIVGSVFSGLAHLMGERGSNALLSPLRELRGIYTLVVSVLVPSILVINQDFVTLWVGHDQFGGTLLSTALALSTVLSTQVFFLSFVCSAAGQVRETAYLAALEAAIRVPLIVAGLHFLGPAGMALSTSLGCGILALVAYPVLVGRGLSLDRATARAAGNEGLQTTLVCIFLGAAGARWLPTTAHWLTLAAKGTLMSLVFLGTTLLLSSAARSQLVIIPAKLTKRFGPDDRLIRK